MDGFTPAQVLNIMLVDLGRVFSAVIDWVGDVASTIVNNPILLITTGFLVVGGAIGIFARLLSKR